MSITPPASRTGSRRGLARPLLTIAGAALLILGGVKGIPLAQEWLAKRNTAGGTRTSLPEVEGNETRLSERPDTLILPDDVIRSMGITTARVEGALAMEPLKLDGTLFLDTNNMVHVHSRFSGDVIEFGQLQPDPAASEKPQSLDVLPSRPIQYGDRVQRGQLLAVIWSKDLGEKKSELMEHLTKLRLSQQKLLQMKELLARGAIPERNVMEIDREVQSDMINVARVDRTLRSWRLSDAEIDSLHGDARKVNEQSSPAAEANWPRVEVRAPISGTILEKNAAVGDLISSDLDIFKIADLSRMDVLAHAYEEDLRALERLPRNDRHWTIALKADPKAAHLDGRFDRIGNIVDPSQHTVPVLGFVDNSSGQLRIGQFVTARIDLPTPPDEVAVPVGALVDLDGKSYVFTQSGPGEFTRRRVYPVRRFENFVAIDCVPPSRAGEDCGNDRLRPGEVVVTTGGIQLTAALQALESAAAVKAPSQSP